jgi:hypothetical protein
MLTTALTSLTKGPLMRLSPRNFLLALFVFLCLAAPAVAAPLILFDESHGQQFVIGKNGPLDLSELAALCQASGFAVKSHAYGLTKEALAPVDVLVISGPFMPLTEHELTAVIDFVDAGGGLAIMLHIGSPVRDLLHRLDVDFTNGTLREMTQVIDGNPLNFKVSLMADHPLTAGLESFSVYGAWALRGTAPHTRILAETSQHGWVDLNHDNKLSESDAVQTFGVMVAGEIGRGRYVVLGDDAIFQNRFLDEANRQLAIRLVNWLGSK